ncbi:uncharacterized protein LOC128682523 [Plodia interpunctella]|uniref:uncharacterized protein LOC128682523 n=1 Tax=Plodia interpunctella TaxID=58824 RepID=UPI002367B824|nr:uncharacterized protein LOC128682523 [Plodia interpunctella]
MDAFAESIFEFVKARQLNIAIAGLLTIMYLLYQYWDVLFKEQDEELKRVQSRISRSRSRSRSGSRYGYKLDNKNSWRGGRKLHKRCPNCSACNFVDE